MSDMLKNTRVIQQSFGQPKDVLSLVRLPLAPLEEGLVRVQIEAANINPSDLLSIYGVGQYKHCHQPPRTPGFEAVGRVQESNCPKWKKGSRVVVATGGTWQKYIDVSPDNLFGVPEFVTDGYACQLYINALTAWVLTTKIARLTARDVVVINAGSSAIGKIFAQLSASLGYTLIVVTSQERDYPYQANHVISSSDDLSYRIEKGEIPAPNVAFDAIGGVDGERLADCLCSKGRFINYGTLSLSTYGTEFFKKVEHKNLSFSTFFLRYWEEKVGRAERRNGFIEMLEHFLTHGIELNVGRRYPLSQFQDALKLVESSAGKLNGKVILSVE
ncbi:zinc-dependent alcohol dehydrogenase family protein [Vibrio sonorensis]|uniref:zinc-dependent alcohol dehydrogenase family protein n=1 Tax=Vibrio sonorensis TaxID=1004316 RepID=UPI0008D95EBA|nr:zinc-dependent alcohol dehydrogenase family protein [Vibrio sonorensis]